MDRLVSKLVGFDDPLEPTPQSACEEYYSSFGMHTQPTDHSNNESAFCLLRILVNFNLAAFDCRVFILVAGPSFED